MPAPFTVLLVEDEPLIAMLYEDIVEGTPFKITDVLLCNADALVALDRLRPDIVVVDYNLTDGPCLPVVRRLRQLSIPFIVATGYGDHTDPDLGSVRWLEKPFRDEDLIRALHECVATTNSRSEQS
jgi:CheY-like chemotaxis protein